MVRRGSVLHGQVASLLHHIVSRKLHPVVVLAVTEEGVQHLHLGVLPGILASHRCSTSRRTARRGDGPSHEAQLVKDGVPVPVHLHVAEDLAPVLLQFLEALDDLFAILAGLEQTHPRLQMLLQESQDVLEELGRLAQLPHL